MAVTAIGWRAHAALVASGGRAEIVAPLSTSFYAHAAGELVWVGPPGTPLHARTVGHSGAPLPHRGSVQLALGDVAPWRPSALAAPPPGIRVAARTLRDGLTLVGEPRGLGRLLAPGTEDDAVTARARPSARALGAACATDDALAAAEAARPLLGLGSGLTPSGDDYVGGVFFGRRLLESRDPDAGSGAAARIVADAAILTHPISARLLADLAAGEGWAPLHDLAAALTVSAHDDAVAAARAVTALGNTSGWDLLAGFVTALVEVL